MENIIIFFIIILIIILMLFKSKNKEIHLLEVEKIRLNNIIQKIRTEIYELHKQIKQKNIEIFNLNSEKDKLDFELTNTKKAVRIAELELEFEIKKQLANYKMNEEMKKLFNDYYEKKCNWYEEYFRFKKRPSNKSADYIAEIKSEYKALQIENRQLKLTLSEFVSDEEKNTVIEKEEHSFDDENKAYKYGKLSKEEWEDLSYIEKLDIVLDRYKNSWKDKLNIGLEFERYCGYLYEKKGYQVKYWGILNGKADGGIDLIAKNKTKTLYIQCKYWGNSKTIRENTISQLFGSALKMAIDNEETYESFIKKVKSEKIRIILLTKTGISEEAKQFCKKLSVIYKENIEIKLDYPRIKLVYGEDKIFYIPTDLQYDNIIFSSSNKEYGRCFTCKEAENLGYRHCYKWRGSN